MALNTLLIIAAGLGAGPGQEPNIDTQIVAPVVSRVGVSTVDGVAQSSEKVTVTFRDSKPSEVLSWLEKHGINFVASADEFSDSTRITLNIQDQPLNDVVNAIARALGGHWERENGIRVFRKGSANFYTPSESTTGFAPLGTFNFKGTQDGKPMTQEDFEKTFGKDFQKKMEAWSKDFQKNFGPEYQKKMETWSKNFEKDFGPEHQKKMEAFSKDFEKQFGPEFQKKMEIFSKDIQGQFTPEMLEKLKADGGGVRFYSLDKDGKLSKEDVDAIKQRAKDSGKVQIFTDKDGKVHVSGDKDGQFRVFTDKDMKFFGDKDGKMRAFTDKEGGFKFFNGGDKDLKFFSDKDGKVRVFSDKDGKGKVFTFEGGKFFTNGDKGGKVFTAPGMKFFTGDKVKGQTFGLPNSLDVENFLKGLTPDQTDKQRKRGYIRYSDLTSEQKKQLGDRPDGKFEITFKVNGDQITIRND